MTTIAAVKKGNKIAIGSDSLTLFGSRKEVPDKMTLNDCKIIKHQSMYLGFSGSVVWGMVLRAYLKNRKQAFKKYDIESLFDEILTFHAILKKEFFLTPHTHSMDCVESSEFMFLIINPKGIFEIDWSRNIREYSQFAAIGTGDEYAFGAMHAVYDLEKSPEKILKIGLEAAAKFDRKTELPANIYTLELL